MTTTTLTPLEDDALPLAAFRAHLRLGTGFAETDLQEPLLASFLRASLAAIEARCNKAIVTKTIRLSLTRWASEASQPLPVAPVQSLAALRIRPARGPVTDLDPADFTLIPDAQSPKLEPQAGLFPSLPDRAVAEVDLIVGYGDWDSVPPDLAQAVLMLAAHYYEYRDDTSLSAGCMPFGVTALLEHYRALRIGGTSDRGPLMKGAL